MKMKLYELALIFVFVVLLFVGTTYILGLFGSKGELKNFVRNRTVEIKSDMLYDYEITKYPSRVEIVDLKSQDISNKIGVSTESSVLNFGIVPIGDNYVKKTIALNGTGKTMPMKKKSEMVFVH